MSDGKSFAKTVALMALCASSLVVAGCDSTPDSVRSGRMDPSVYVPEVEGKSPLPYPDFLYEASNRISQEIVQDLQKFKAIEDSPVRVVIFMGDMNNQTDGVSSNDFEIMRSRIRNNLLQSSAIREKIQFVESRARVEALAQKENVAGGGVRPAYDPVHTYALNGDFKRHHRPSAQGDINQYYVEFQLVNMASGEIFPLGTAKEIKQFRGK